MGKKCNRYHALICEEMYETGMEQYCKCQCTLDAEFDPELWGWKINKGLPQIEVEPHE